MIDVAAPGVKINGAARGGGTTTMDGTSMASPHIAGVVALIRSVNPGYSSQDAVNAMKNSCTNLGNSAFYEAGIPDLANLVPVSSSVIWYDLNSEANQYLSPNSTYYYRIYGIHNGVEKMGDIKSFRTSDGVSTSLSVTTGGADSITGTNATVRGSASYSGNRPSEVGLYFGTSPDNMSKVASDTINHNKNPFDIWYDLNSEAKQALSPNTTYYYRIYGIQNGVEVTGETKSFMTAGVSNTRIGVVRGTDGSLVINSRPHIGYDIGYIPEGASVTVYPDQTSGNWYWVTYHGISGYSYKDYIVLQ